MSAVYPAINTPVAATDSGKMNPIWYRFFRQFFNDAENNFFTDRSDLSSATISGSLDRVYVRYFDAKNKDCFNAEASGPHISGHWMRQHEISGSGTIAQRNAAGWGDAQNGQYWLQTDITPNLVWWWLSTDNGLFDSPIWYEAGYVGYAWEISNEGSTYWQVDEIEPNACQMGALNGPAQTTDDTLALKSLAGFFQMGRNCFMPSGYYTTTDTITLQTLGKNTWRGEGGYTAVKSTVIYCSVDNAIEISEPLAGQGFWANLCDFAAVASTGDGIHSLLTSGNGVTGGNWRNVGAFGKGYGFYIPLCFSQVFTNCLGISILTGHGWAISGGPGTLFNQCIGGSTGTLTAAFRAGSHSITMIGCNVVSKTGGSGNAAYGCLLGQYANVTGTATAGGANTITLAVGTPFVVDQPVARNVRLTGGAGSGQTKTITAYNSGTRVATVDSNWSVNPDATTTYSIEDPVSFLQGTPSSNVGSQVLASCNFEDFTKNGVRTVGDTGLTILGGTFLSSLTPESNIRLSPDGGNAQVAIINPVFANSGTAPADILTEGDAQLLPYIDITYYDVTIATVQRTGPGDAATVVADLPPVASCPIGTRGFVTNATATTFASIVAGGGTDKVPVVNNGTNWIIG